MYQPARPHVVNSVYNHYTRYDRDGVTWEIIIRPQLDQERREYFWGARVLCLPDKDRDFEISPVHDSITAVREVAAYMLGLCDGVVD